MYLLDTNVLSNLEKLRPDPNLVAWLRATNPAELAVPLSAIFEIQHGIELARASHPERARQKETWLERILDADDGQVLRPGIKDARLRGRMLAMPALRDFIVQHPNSTKLKTGEDIAIAAMAIVRNAVLVTYNERDFERIHRHFPLPGLYHPGRREWIIPATREAANPTFRLQGLQRYRIRYGSYPAQLKRPKPMVGLKPPASLPMAGGHLEQRLEMNRVDN